MGEDIRRISGVPKMFILFMGKIKEGVRRRMSLLSGIMHVAGPNFCHTGFRILTHRCPAMKGYPDNAGFTFHPLIQDHRIF